MIIIICTTLSLLASEMHEIRHNENTIIEFVKYKECEVVELEQYFFDEEIEYPPPKHSFKVKRVITCETCLVDEGY